MPKILANKEDWIKLGYKLFSEQGISGIVVEKMAKTLKVNKSSFYWHFKTRRKFIEELVNSWKHNETERIINLTNKNNTGKEKLDRFIALIYKQNSFLDFVFYLKSYARYERGIQVIIDEIDDKRIEYAIDLLKEIGYSKQDAEIKAKTLHKHFIGYHETIRYKKQSVDYLKEVKLEINQIIKY